MATLIDPIPQWEIVVRLVLATLAGVLVGWEREQVNRPAGLRTYALVSVGSALFTILSMYAFGPADPSRIAAQIITGIGFLGAGTIFKYRNKVLGLTTAAGLWSIAGVGMGFGAGYYFITIVAALIIFFLMRFYKTSKTRQIIEHEMDALEKEGSKIMRVGMKKSRRNTSTRAKPRRRTRTSRR